MAGHASNWFKSGTGSAKGRVFISNATLAAAGLTKANMASVSSDMLAKLAQSSVQPKSQAKEANMKTTVATAKPTVTTPKVTSILHKAGFVAAKTTTGYVDGVYTKIQNKGYSAQLVKYGPQKGLVGIDIALYMEQKQGIIRALENAGYTVTEKKSSTVQETGILFVS